MIELPDPAAAPFESGTTLLTPFSSDSKLAEITLAHQIAHSMFISPRAWVDEGVPHFAQALWREHESGRQAALDYMGLHRTALADAEKLTSSQPDTAGQHALPNTVDEEFYRSKAMFVWWMLRDIIGDAGLKRALSAYDPEKDKNQAYIQNLLQSESQRNLAWLFDDWVYNDRGLPDFRVLSAYPRSLDSGAYMVTVTRLAAVNWRLAKIESGSIGCRLDRSTAKNAASPPAPMTAAPTTTGETASGSQDDGVHKD